MIILSKPSKDEADQKLTAKDQFLSEFKQRLMHNVDSLPDRHNSIRHFLDDVHPFMNSRSYWADGSLVLSS